MQGQDLVEKYEYVPKEKKKDKTKLTFKQDYAENHSEFRSTCQHSTNPLTIGCSTSPDPDHNNNDSYKSPRIPAHHPLNHSTLTRYPCWLHMIDAEVSTEKHLNATSDNLSAVTKKRQNRQQKGNITRVKHPKDKSRGYPHPQDPSHD